MQFRIELVLVILAASLSITLARNVRGAKVCEAKSFDYKKNIVTNDVKYDENKIIIIYDIDPKKPIPNNFDNDKDYTDTCFNEMIFKIAKTSEPSSIETIPKKPSEFNVQFSKLEYLTEYQIQSFYTQKSPSSAEVLTDSFKYTTCFGQPEKLINLKASKSSDGKLEISWDKPSVIRAPKVCYYQLTVTSVDDSIGPQEDKTADTKMTVTTDTNKEYKISVISFNDNSYNGTSCYPSRPTGDCKQQGSVKQEITYTPTGRTTNPPITTPSGSYSFHKNSHIYVFSIIFSFIYFVSL